MHRGDLHQIPPDEPDPLWALLAVAAGSVVVAVTIFWLAVSGVL